MQLDADRYPLLYSLRGALSPTRKNAKAARQAAQKRRAWTAEYSQLVFSLIDARREAEALREAGAPKAAVDAAAEARWAIEKRVHEGAGPGARLRVRAPTTGQDMTVTVPAGVEAGGLFDVPLPEPRLPSLGE